jgi:hypothetical protein
MISRRLVWAAVDGGHYSRFVPRCGSEDHWNSTRTQILEEALCGMVDSKVTEVAPLSSRFDYLLPAKRI